MAHAFISKLSHSASTSHHQPQLIPIHKMCIYRGYRYEDCGHEVRYFRVRNCSTQFAFLTGATESECQEKTWEFLLMRSPSLTQCEICEVEGILSPTNELLRKSQQTADLISEVLLSMNEAS